MACFARSFLVGQSAGRELASSAHLMTKVSCNGTYRLVISGEVLPNRSSTNHTNTANKLAQKRHKTGTKTARKGCESGTRQHRRTRGRMARFVF